MTIDDLLERHGAYVLEKQEALSAFLGEHRWDVDVPAGTVDFGAGRVFPIQLIGTESAADGSWLWAWANAPVFTEPATRVCRIRRSQGLSHRDDREPGGVHRPCRRSAGRGLRCERSPG